MLKTNKKSTEKFFMSLSILYIRWYIFTISSKKINFL